MTDNLSAKTCTPCRGGIPPLDKAEATAYLDRVPGWALEDDAHRLQRSFRFGNFREALEFVTSVGALAEREGHHPDVSFGWGWATVTWQTKKIKGLHENDFIMAAKTSELAVKHPRAKS
jgi:4a-hydroxytetrahydrobiopterin dehydratase